MKRIVKPDCLGDPSIWGLDPKLFHEYNVPEKGEDIVKSINWMMSVYDNVVIEYGSEYGCSFCNLCGDVRKD